MVDSGGLVRPSVTEEEAESIARECFGIEVTARELGSNQDRNFLLTEPSGARSVLRVDNPAFGEDARDAQHAALDAYAAVGVPVARVLPGPDGALTQRWRGLAVRRSSFAEGVPLVDAGYFAPVVLREFGELAAASVNALASLEHPGLDRENMWDMRVAHAEVIAAASSIADVPLRERVLAVADEANDKLAAVVDDLHVQPIHGDLTDDNVMGVRGSDARLHPQTLLDLGDLGLGWRVAELAVTVSSMLHHDPEQPHRVLETIEAFHRVAPLTQAEALAVWPLVVLRAALLVASAHRQLAVDGDNSYARDRVAGEHAIFAAAIAHPLREMSELVLARLEAAGLEMSADSAAPGGAPAPPLRALLPGLAGEVALLDAGVESELLGAGAWLDPEAERGLVEAALGSGASAAVFPYGACRLTRTRVDSALPAPTWPAETEIWLPGGGDASVAAPVAGAVRAVSGDTVELEMADWVLVCTGLVPTVQDAVEIVAGDPLGTLAAADAPRVLTVGLRRADAPPRTERAGSATCVAPELVPAWLRLSADPAPLLGLVSQAQGNDSAAELARRERIFASAQERYYDRPMQIERGWRHHLVDTTGRAYVDMVNNVTGLGHGHPGVADAANRQLRLLATNSRFLYRSLAEYSERLLELLPVSARETGPGRDALDTVLLVNSGSEAVDLALRLAQAATGRRTIVALREAYHGWTMASDGVTTSAYDNPFALESRPDWVHVADVPNRFRGTYRGEACDPAVAEQYAADLGGDIERLDAEGRAVAGFICESVLGNAGGVLLPEGYLAGVYERVREAGGLCIADEVQVGFGRMGSTFWGFEQSEVVPDIVTIAKPMGNGFPIGGVITSKRIADALATQGQFFASTGGNPVSCQVGIAVLDAMREEGLQQNALLVGDHLAQGFAALAERHDLIGPVHGRGLYLGVELVRDRVTLEPADTEAAGICERLRELGVVVLTTSERSNVLKVKPPLCLTLESADFVLEQLDRVLTEGW